MASDHVDRQEAAEGPRKKGEQRGTAGSSSDHEGLSHMGGGDGRKISASRLSPLPEGRGGDARRTSIYLQVPPPDYATAHQSSGENLHAEHSTEGADTHRRKSILSNRSHNAHSFENRHPFDYRRSISSEDGLRKKLSITESLGVVSNLSKNLDEQKEDRSCWLRLGLQSRRLEPGGASWSPPHYDALCPAPLCPAYRRVARVAAVLVAGLLAWVLAAALFGDVALPGGQLLDLAVLAVASYLGACLFSLVKVPEIVGMFAVGILFQNVGLFEVGEFQEVVAVLRETALVIILIRAGLDLDPPALNRMRITVPKLALVPWVVECVVVAITTHFLLHMPWMWGLLLGSSIAAVSPAVLVPSLCRLRVKGFGVSKGIPTLIVAVSGVDDATSVAIFSIIHSIMFSKGALYRKILFGPLSLLGGVGIGIFWGILSKYIPKKSDPYVVPLRILMLLGGGLAVMLGSKKIGASPAGPIACVTGAFTSLCCWSHQGWGVEHNPVNTAFEIFWIFFEPILFGVSGAQIVISELEPHVVGLILACVISGILIRIAVTIVIAVGSKLNMKEKIFVSISWMSKAGVQAALAPVALRSVEHGTEQEKSLAHRVLLTSVLSILLTAPVAATIIALAGPRLLRKTEPLPPTDPHARRASRLSIRSLAVAEHDDDEE